MDTGTLLPESGPVRFRAIDALRGTAALMVLVVHAPLSDSVTVAISSGVVGKVVGRIISLGTYGVDLFFVLSGFLISGLLFKEFRQNGTLSLGRFWIRRGLKIWPSYFVAYGSVLAYHLAVDWLSGGGKAQILRRLQYAIPNILLVQNYFPETRWFASWSLAIEEHFYLIFPLILYLLLKTRCRLRCVPILGVAAILCVPAARVLALRSGVDIDKIYLYSHFRADGLCCGVLLGYWFHFHRQVVKVPHSLVIMASLFLSALLPPLLFPWKAGVTETFGLTILYVGFMGVVAIAAAHPEIGFSSPFGPVFRLLERIGVYSYTIYLAQCGVLVFSQARAVDHWVERVAGGTVDLRALVFIVGCLVSGVVLSHVVERPFLRLRGRWFPSNIARRVAVI